MPRKKSIPNLHHLDANKITFRVSASTKAQFDRACFLSGLSMTAVLNQMIEAYLKEKAQVVNEG